jgi:hypothetical protein
MSCSGRGTASQPGRQTDRGAMPLQERTEGRSVQNTAARLLTITRIGVPLLSSATPVPEGHYPHAKIAGQYVVRCLSSPCRRWYWYVPSVSHVRCSLLI